jgi:hypothetical protein
MLSVTLILTYCNEWIPSPHMSRLEEPNWYTCSDDASQFSAKLILIWRLITIQQNFKTYALQCPILQMERAIRQTDQGFLRLFIAAKKGDC